MVELNLLVEIEDLNIHNFVSMNKKITSATFDPTLYTSDSKDKRKPKSKKESKMESKQTDSAHEIEVSTADNSTIEIEEYDTEADVQKQLENTKVNFHRVLYGDYESFVKDRDDINCIHDPYLLMYTEDGITS